MQSPASQSSRSQLELLWTWELESQPQKQSYTAHRNICRNEDIAVWSILRGIANFIVALILFAIPIYALLWGFFFLLKSLHGHCYGAIARFNSMWRDSFAFAL